MTSPKPISIEYVSPEDYAGISPQPFVIVGEAPEAGAPLPALATAAELQAGTVTAARLVSPKLIKDEIARQIAAIPAA